MASRRDGFQFLRFQGYPRGPRHKRGTLSAILAEGLRMPGHISHLPGSPHIEVYRVDSPISEAAKLGDWINEQMSEARNQVEGARGGSKYTRAVASNSLAIGACIISHPETMEEYSAERFKVFSEETTQ